MAAQALSHSIPCSTAHGSRRLRQSLPVHTRRTQRAAAPQCLAFVTGSDGFSGGSSLLSQAASVVGLGLAAWVAARAVDGQAAAERSDGSTECPRCDGTGYVECPCTRWSDGDAGCATCKGTARSACPACGGGGTAVPRTAKIVASRGADLRSGSN